ncbi:UNVERIFIED_CONTAM: hypothetical protein K2H54_010061 [Gekko kuhli]
MLVLDSQEELQVLKKELQSCFPESLKVYGAVLNICQENTFHQEILVDSWPSFHAVIARPQREKASSKTNYFAGSYAVFYRELGAYQQLAKDTDAIDWSQEFLLQGLQEGVYQTSQALAAVKHFSAELVSRTRVFVLPKPLNLSAGTPTAGSELQFSSLDVTQAPLLNDTWSVGGTEQSLQYLTQLISSFPSSCLLDAGGRPVSWVLLDQFGCLTHAYTLPAHRGKGCIQQVIAALARKLEKTDHPVYGDVLEDNTSMKRALQCLGAHFTSCFLFYDLQTPLGLQ